MEYVVSGNAKAVRGMPDIVKEHSNALPHLPATTKTCLLLGLEGPAAHPQILCIFGAHRPRSQKHSKEEEPKERKRQ